MKRILPLLVCCGFASTAAAQTPAPDLRTARMVYHQLARQLNDGRPPVPLVLSTRRGAIAEYDPAAHVIRIDAAALHSISQLGPDSLNALSYILGHELVHFYNDHAARFGFSNFFAPLATVQQGQQDTAWQTRNALYQKWQFETEADFRAGFAAYLAGYQPLASVPRVLRHIYKDYGIDTASTASHPPLSDRLAIVQMTQRALDDVVAMFEGATQLMVMRRHAEAGRVYEHIARTFPAREVLLNAGTAKLLEALALLGARAKFVYPVELDTRIRARDVQPDDAKATRARALLADAQQLFEQARLRDADYLPAQLNLAIVMHLLGRNALASGMAEDIRQQAKLQGAPATAAHALILKGILLAHSNNATGAEAEFKAASAHAPQLAERNIAILKNLPVPATVAPAGAAETIGAMSPTDFQHMTDGAATRLSLRATADIPELRLSIKHFGNGVSGFLVSNERGMNMMLSADSTYAGESARGVRIGSSGEEVRSRYGTPDHVLATSRGSYLVYSTGRIAFGVDTRGRVTGWTIFADD